MICPPTSINITEINLLSVTETGVTIAVIPKTAIILNILDPIRFPIEIAFLFLRIAITDAAN